MNDGTQKEKMIILSFGDVDDVLVGKFNCF